MPEKRLHIISFDIPYPPDYGGVIDVYYKLKALHEAGVKITLHCFEYNREKASELGRYCEKIYYYPRETGFLSNLHYIPYIVRSRRSRQLLQNLLGDDAPVLFEGLHSCYYLRHPALKNRKKIYRESNIEHHYYMNLALTESNWLKKAYFYLEAAKLYFYQRVLRYADIMFVVSEKDTEYLKMRFPNIPVSYLPSFHANEEMNVRQGRGDYAFYHGNLAVPENAYAARFLVTKVFDKLARKLVIAGKNPPKSLRNMAFSRHNLMVIANPSEDELLDYLQNAHINVLTTFQATGLKLKLLNTLYNGRFCLVNSKMVQGTGLEGLCEIADKPRELREKVEMLFDLPFENEIAEQRKAVLDIKYSNRKNAAELINRIF